MYLYVHTSISLSLIYIYVYTYTYVYIHGRLDGLVPWPDTRMASPHPRLRKLTFFFSGEVKPAQIRVTSSFISLGLVYPPPQPLISNRPRQCRKSAN